MKSKIPFQILILLLCQALSAQVKIGDNPQTINPASLLELESTQQVLVITRVTTEQMEAIVPSNGALVYNIDESCLAYYDGERWINLCEALRLSFTTDPIVNQDTTMIITEIGDQINFEVGRIRGGDDSGVFNNIVDFSVTSQDIQNNAINAAKLAPNSVGNEEIEDNAVTAAEIDLVDVTLSDFINDVPFLEGGDLIAANVGFDPTSSGLAATNVQDAIDQLILGADFPYNTDFEVVGQQLVLTDFGGSLNVPLSEINNQDLVTDGTPGNIALSNGGNELNLNVADADADPGNEIQEITSTDNSVTIAQTGNDYDLSVPAGSDDQNLTGAVLDGTNLTISIEDGNPAVADLSSLATDAELAALNVEDADADPGNEIQDLEFVGGIISLTGDPTPTAIDLSNYDSNGADDFDGDWSSLTNIPPDIADGDDNTQRSEAEVDAFVANNGFITTVISDGTTILGDGVGVPLSVGEIEGGPSGNIVANSITQGDIGDNAIGSAELQADSVGESELEDAAVTPAKIQPGADGDVLTTVGGAVAWQAPAIKAWGKIAGGGGVPLGGTGIASVIANSPNPGDYTINFDTPFLNEDYTIQLTVQGDSRIWVENQTVNNCVIRIEDSTGAPGSAVFFITIIE